MRTTPLRLIFGLAAIGGAVGWTVLALVRATMTAVPQLPWSAAGGLAFFAVLLFSGAWYMWSRVHRKSDDEKGGSRREVNALFAVRLLLLGKASALVGALALGGYLGFGLHRFRESGEWSEQVTIAFVTSGAATLVVAGALLLERACKVPEDHDPDPEGVFGSP